MSRKVISLFVLLALLVVSAVSINAQDEETVIGVLLPSNTGEYYEGLVEGVETTAAEIGVEVVVLVSDNDLETEATNLELLIEQGVNALLIDPVDVADSLDVIAAANEAGIPVFVLTSEIDLTGTEIEVTSMIGIDNTAAGELAGEYLCTTLEETGTILELVNMPVMEEDMEAEESDDAEMTMTPAEARSAGFEAYMTENCGGVTVEMFDVTEMEEDDIVAALREIVSGEDAPNAIFATNDVETLLAMRAVIRARASGEVQVFGFNATADTLGAITAGQLNGVISPSGGSLGVAAIEAAANFLSGEEIDNVLTLDPLVINADAIDAVRRPCLPNDPNC